MSETPAQPAQSIGPAGTPNFKLTHLPQTFATTFCHHLRGTMKNNGLRAKKCLTTDGDRLTEEGGWFSTILTTLSAPRRDWQSPIPSRVRRAANRVSGRTCNMRSDLS